MSKFKEIKNNVTFQVGDNIMNESFEDAFEACYFIEQSPFKLIEAEINGEKKSKQEAERLTYFVAPTEYISTLKKSNPTRMQEILGTIAWYQDMLDAERLREAERMYASDKVFATDFKF